jgi:glycerophosphodiester phosphodiesterase
LETVDEFYTRKYSEYSRQLRLLRSRYDWLSSDDEQGALSSMDNDEVDDLLGSLLELRGQLRKLQWYSDVNRRGFIKITKKLDKKMPGSNAQAGFVTSKLEPKAFAGNHQLLADMKLVNDWLGKLGDRISNADKRSSTSTLSSDTAVDASKQQRGNMANLLPDVGALLEQAIKDDDPSAVSNILETTGAGDSSKKHEALNLILLQKAISARAVSWIDYLLPRLPTLEETDDIHHRNCIHRLVISIGRSSNKEWSAAHSTSQAESAVKSETRQFLVPAALPVRAPQNRKKSEPEIVHTLNSLNAPAKLLVYILGQLQGQQRDVLKERDLYGRLPLHYAAEFGLRAVCETLVKFMSEWGQLEDKRVDAASWWDADKLTPLHLSVMNRHIMTTKVLLGAEESVSARERSTDGKPLVLLTTEINATDILTVLMNAGFDINQQDEEGETALHAAARLGYKECAKVLLESRKIKLDLKEYSFAWTPLFVAAVNGQLDIVKLLLEAGADAKLLDDSGWTAKEHAVLRGFMDIGTYFKEHEPAVARGQQDGVMTNGNGAHKTLSTKGAVKTFGHRYLTDESMVLLSLGSMDTRSKVQPVELDAIPLSSAHSTQLDTALSIVVSAIGATGEAVIVDLPPQETISTEPMSFMTKDESQVKVIFDIVPTYAGSNEGIVGRGVALLSSVKTSMGQARMNLRGDVTVPIMAAKTMEIIGRVHFNFLIVKPFSHPNMSISEDRTYWTKPIIIGHRGFGKNTSTRKSLQLGENTIESFIAAANLGASYVEFDVQLTKDLVPVIYHDFLVSETGIDAPVHLLTKEQFLHLGDSRHPKSTGNSSPRARSRDPPLARNEGPNSGTSSVRDSSPPDESPRPRSLSVGSSDGTLLSVTSDRMKHTRDFKAAGGYKANMYGKVIRAPWTTLEQMFRAKDLPVHVGFNIELKYPTLLEAEEQEMDSYSIEINTFVDRVLQTVYDFAKKDGRHIIFSSFHPDVCLLLAMKQPSIPVLFLTESGTTDMGDVRCQSLQQAIRFASRWSLLGIVSEALPLVLCPRLVRVVKESGLVCVSYGVSNNEPDMVKVSFF